MPLDSVPLSVLSICARYGIVCMPGALTPTEIYHAWSCGAAMVKVFPCSALGPQYIRDLLGPFDRIPLVAVGGVSSENAADFLDSGAKAVGVGMSLFGRKAVIGQKPRAIATTDSEP